MEFLHEEQSVWEYLRERKTAHRPLWYGRRRGQDPAGVRGQWAIAAAAVFASDEFVRGHSLAGFRVQRAVRGGRGIRRGHRNRAEFCQPAPRAARAVYELDARFSLVAPDVPVAGGGLFDLDYVRAHADDLQRAYGWMADAQSRQVFADIVNFKVSGKIAYLRHCESGKDEVFRNILRPTAHEHFADLGAYNGDTIRELLGYTGGAYASITALEPDRRNFKSSAGMRTSSYRATCAWYRRAAVGRHTS